MARYRFSDGKTVVASSPEEFVKKMRFSSWYPGKSTEEFMQMVSERADKIGLHVRRDSEYNFLADLIGVGIVDLEPDPVWN
jgi:hypothetical protein